MNETIQKLIEKLEADLITEQDWVSWYESRKKEKIDIVIQLEKEIEALRKMK